MSINTTVSTQTNSVVANTSTYSQPTSCSAVIKAAVHPNIKNITAPIGTILLRTDVPKAYLKSYRLGWIELATINDIVNISTDQQSINSFIGRVNSTSLPTYSSTRVVPQNASLSTAISKLDQACGHNADSITNISNTVTSNTSAIQAINTKVNNVYTKSETYNKTEIDTMVDNSDLAWANIQDKPTTIGGYGITDAYTKNEINVHTDNNVIHVTQVDKDKWNAQTTTSFIYYIGAVGDTMLTLTHNINSLDYTVEYIDMNTNTPIYLIATHNTNTLVIDDLCPLIMINQLKIIIKI